MKKVIAFGSFDVLHPGHLMYLSKAKSLGDYLIVVVARDDSIRKLKGREPALKQRDRVRLVGSLRGVDKAVLGNAIRTPTDRYKILKKYGPDVVVFGYDQNVSVPEVRAWLASNGMHARVVRIGRGLKTSAYKSSIIKKLLEGPV